MKKIFLLLFLGLLCGFLFLSSCKKDESAPTPDAIVSTWKTESGTDKLIINSDGTWTWTGENDPDESGTWSNKGADYYIFTKSDEKQFPASLVEVSSKKLLKIGAKTYTKA